MVSIIQSSMADIISKPCLEKLFFSVDPMSLTILSQNSDTQRRLNLLSNDFSGFERGSRYDEYSKRRDSKLCTKRGFQKFLDEEDVQEPRIKKQFRFEGNSVIGKRDAKLSPMKKRTLFELSPIRKAVLPSSLAQSVPDFSAVLRKENRRPPVNYNVTTPKSRNGGVLTGSVSRGSKSARAGEKKMMMGMARKSYASVDDLKKLSTAAASSINGRGGGRRVGDSGVPRSVLGYSQFY